MAERYPEVPLPTDPIEARIHAKFDQLIVCLNRRREQLIAEHRERRAATTTRVRTVRELADTRAHLQTQMKENLLRSMRERMVAEIETRMAQLEVSEREVEVLFECHTRQLEETISALGQLAEREIVPVTVTVPNYPALLQPRISVGKIGLGLGELDCPNGIAFDERTKLIYVANESPFSIKGNIIVFSVTGEYINTFCKGQVVCPVGIAINGDEVYVSDSALHCILHFKLPGFRFITKVRKKGTGNGEFNSPRQLTVAPNGSMFIADRNNHRVVVMTNKLKFQYSISHANMTLPNDVKLLDNEVFVLSWSDNPCVHVFSQSGEKLRSLITCGEQSFNQIIRGYSFCFDKQQNILISDSTDQSIKVFSREGVLLHTLGYTQVQPMGITVTNDNKIICSSFGTNFGLHLFFD